MIKKLFRSVLIIVFIIFDSSLFPQSKTYNNVIFGIVQDSLRKRGINYNPIQEKSNILLNKDQALKFLMDRYRTFYWNNPGDPLRQTIGQLNYLTSHNPFDSTENYLNKYQYDLIKIPRNKFYVWDSLKIKIPVISLARINLYADSLLKADTNLIKKENDSLVFKHELIKPEQILKDTTILIIVDTLNKVTSSNSGFPFRYYNSAYEGDSVEIAIKSLVKFLEDRDSTVIYFTGTTNTITPVWINSKTNRMVRYWLKNEFSDSVAVWIGSISKNKIGLYVEDGINFRRPVKQTHISDARMDLNYLENSKLKNIRRIAVRPQYWVYRSEAAVSLTQASLTNWVKGGESSISTVMDVTGFADYENKEAKLLSNNFIRLKYGLVKSGKEKIRKNFDLFETNSKLNHKAIGKFDFSAIMLFKTQIARGYNYIKRINNEDSAVLVSKFANPVVLTLGLGLDFKPNKTTSINFSPLSYKGTFVTDTAHIDQTKYGIQKNKKSLIEPGASLQITNEFSPVKTVVITNRLQMFTNYIHHPQNIDIDWEMIATINLNWFTDVRLNTQLIFDDDTKTPELDKSGTPILRPDGSQKKSVRIQFKELLGLTFLFRF